MSKIDDDGVDFASALRAGVSEAGDPDAFISRAVAQKIFDAARECYRRWQTTPNRDAYVGVELERAARAAVAAVGADLIAAGRAQAAADIRSDRDGQFACIERWLEKHDVRGYLTFGDIEQLVTNLEALRYEGSTVEVGGEADQSKCPVWWLHRCNPEDPKLSWLSETPGEQMPAACPRCGGAGWGWFEARPVGVA